MAPYVGKPCAGQVVMLDRDCDLGSYGERAVVLETDGHSMTLVFSNRDIRERVVETGADYLYLKII